MSILPLFRPLSPARTCVSLDGDDLLQTVHSIGREFAGPFAAEVDRDSRFPSEAFEALKRARLLSAVVPQEAGGLGLKITQVSKVCELLGQYCASTGLIYAMHSIQVASIVHHAQQSVWFQKYLRQLVSKQHLLASATTELGAEAISSSACALEVRDRHFQLTKRAPVISYIDAADDILITCRKSPEAPRSHQVLVLARRDECTSERLSNWDTMGFRGTCSIGSVLTARGNIEQVLPTPFSEILAQTMHPYSHITWCSVWTGIAKAAFDQALKYVRSDPKRAVGETPGRLVAIDQLVQQLRQSVGALARDYDQMLALGKPQAFSAPDFVTQTNNLKISCSEQVIAAVTAAMQVCGMQGFRNDSPFSVARHLRDAFGAALMVNNDRIRSFNATVLLAKN